MRPMPGPHPDPRGGGRRDGLSHVGRRTLNGDRATGTPGRSKRLLQAEAGFECALPNLLWHVEVYPRLFSRFS